jgi:hypothetical protein
MDSIYIRQTELLLRVLPYVHEIGVFALHGGTAINLFHDEMPRLSIDIDLTYLPIVNRETDLDFSYSVYEYQRSRLLNTLLKSLNRQHLYFLQSVAENKPDWVFGDWSSFPGISWKLKNLLDLERNNKAKFQDQILALSRINLW